MDRILIIGSSAAGKSSLAIKLGEILGKKVHHLDAYYWQPNWRPLEKEKFREVNHRLVQDSEWIIDGFYGSTFDIRLKEADTVILLDYSRYLCMYRAIKRRIQYNGTIRPDMGSGCKEKIDLEFLKYIWDFPKNKMSEINQSLAESELQRVIRLESPKETEQFIRNVKEKMSQETG
ncbi:DNA topology modulation protein [Halalkalibacillus halophilus]|uniref:DNA topology modulation protein n=1 Tax=Halalkalibacillus halophilus TaxID=392827 RepID=UPI0004178A50|nr:DNA topology modulation protein [Halalkalibacillus halophilus]